VSTGIDDATLDASDLDDELLMDDFDSDDEVLPDDLGDVDYMEAWCPSCAAKRPHALIEDDEQQIIMCAECHDEHPREAVQKPRPKAQAAVSRAMVSPEDLASAASTEAAWKRLTNANSNGTSVDYHVKCQLRVADLVNHPSFGLGVVYAMQAPNKAEVLFQDKARRLVCNR